ncbi:hypothetical protein RRSWK_06182 [Rhodopirellula sp. SWK7]|nr:hypothetical protein RRSWK_06182 [Rhodopirellula sp. SWK7]
MSFFGTRASSLSKTDSRLKQVMDPCLGSSIDEGRFWGGLSCGGSSRRF